VPAALASRALGPGELLISAGLLFGPFVGPLHAAAAAAAVLLLAFTALVGTFRVP